MPDITREDCFPDGQRPQNWTTYGGGTDYTMSVRICELCGNLVRLGYLDRHVASHGNPDAAVIDPTRAMPDPSNIDRAAKLLGEALVALANAGLLVTDEIQAVVDLAVEWHNEEDSLEDVCEALDAAVVAYLATRGPT
jgi:hypothetical protein